MAIGDTGTFTDPRDGQVYPWKIMKDGKKWMTKNLNFKTPNSYYYDRNASNAKYGRLYNYKEAKTAIPAGWRLPTPYKDWDGFFNAYDIDSMEGLEKLRPGGITGFDVLYGGGYFDNIGKFAEINELAAFWTKDGSEQNGEPTPWVQMILDPIQKGTKIWKNGFSVRCVADV